MVLETPVVRPEDVKSIIGKHILRDGLDLVMDLERSHGAYLYDSLRNRELLDFFSCFATIPLGYNHPKIMGDEGFKRDLLDAALINPSNSDIYTTQYARFMQTFDRVGIPSYLPHSFLISGGALAVENALKVAMDWKVQKNFMKGYRREIGHKVLHFQEAFHGRSGYTLSLTNTDPAKTRYFARFEDWPRVLNPKIHFPETDAKLEDLDAREKLSIRQIKRAFKENKDEICAIIIEPIQCEGGDNYFRKSYMEKLRVLADENDALLIHDEVQSGCAVTGRFWAHEHLGKEARPDIVVFGKKMQICGILAGPKIDEVPTNCFRVSSRINSTWGGNLADMVRSYKILEIIEEDSVLDHVEDVGAYFKKRFETLAAEHSGVTNVRGRGLLLACDLPSAHLRNEFIRVGFENGALFLGCATHSIRFRPTLTVTHDDIDNGLEIIEKTLKQIGL